MTGVIDFLWVIGLGERIVDTILDYDRYGLFKGGNDGYSTFVLLYNMSFWRESIIHYF